MEEQWFWYFMVDEKRFRHPDLELRIGDRICVLQRLVTWFSWAYGIPQHAHYGFKVTKLKEKSGLSVSADGVLGKINI